MRAIVAVLAFAVIAAIARPSAACSCVRREIDDAFAAASYVIVAKVVAKVEPEDDDDDFHELRFELEVQGVWKGAAKHKMFIVTRRGGGDCGRGARILSQRWVFFAHEADGRLFTSICDNSEQATDAVITKMTKKFGAPKNPKS